MELQQKFKTGSNGLIPPYGGELKNLIIKDKNLKVKIRTYGYKKINFIIILSTSSNYFLKNFIFSVNTFSCSLSKLESTISGRCYEL